MHFYSPHLIADHQSETEWAWEGGRQQSHMKGDWEYIFHFTTANLNHQKHCHLKIWPPILACFQVFICATLFLKKQNYTVPWIQSPLFYFNAFWKGSRALHKLFSYLVVQDILAKIDMKSGITWRAAFSLLTHVDAWLQKPRFCCKRTWCIHTPPPSQKPSSAKMRRRTGAVEPSRWPKHTWTFSLTICLQCWSMPLMKYSV